MPRHYIRKSNRASYSEETLQTALTEIRNGRSKASAAKQYNIPRSTLIKRLKKNATPVNLGRFTPTFSSDQEKELCEHIIKMDRIFHGLNIRSLRKLAYDFAELNNISHRFSQDKKLAGKDWVDGFFHRNPQLSLRKPEATSLNRVLGFNKLKVDEFYSNLQSLLDKYKFKSSNIYNMDESGITNVHVPERVISEKGKKQVGRLTSAERGATTTVVCAMSAAGEYIPPMIIFARKRKNDQLMKGAPINSITHLTQSGWMDQDGFLVYLQHFATYAHCSPENPVLLILDGHASHKSLPAILKARELGIHLLTIPPHTSHRLQPLDRTFFGPLKTFYNQECSTFMTNNPGKRITVYDIAELFNKSYLKAATMNNAIKGFQVTGIWPFNDGIFTEADYVNVYNNESSRSLETIPNISLSDIDLPREVTPPPGDPNLHTPREVTPTPEDPKLSEQILDTEQRGNQGSHKLIRSSCSASSSRMSRVEEISPFLIATRSEKEKARKVQKSDILTSTPYKDALEINQQVDEKKRKAVSKKIGSDIRNPITKSTASKQSISKSKANKKSSKAKKYKRAVSCSSSEVSENMSVRDSSDDYDVPIHFCIICKEELADPPDEEMIKCLVCKEWAHEDCTDFEPKKKTYICDFCRN